MNRLVIGKPTIEKSTNGNYRLVSHITIDEEAKHSEGRCFAEFPGKFADYIVSERVDSFLVGFLHYALYHRLDIKCEAPVSAELHYYLTKTLIPALTSICDRRIRIYADLVEKRSDVGFAIGTGASCGIDSLFLLKRHLNHPVKNLRLTHVAINNVGAFRSGSGQFLRAVENSKRLAEEAGLASTEAKLTVKVIASASNDYYHFDWLIDYCYPTNS